MCEKRKVSLLQFNVLFGFQFMHDTFIKTKKTHLTVKFQVIKEPII